MNMSLREEQLRRFSVGEHVDINYEEDVKDLVQDKFKRDLLKLEKQRQEELWEGKEIMPFGYNLMIVPTDGNPYLQKISDSGLMTDAGGLFTNPDSGKDDMLERGICYAVVEQVGPDVKHIRKGDEIIYVANRLMPLPFKGMGYCLLNEGQVLGVIGKASDLEPRFKNVSYANRAKL